MIGKRVESAKELHQKMNISEKEYREKQQSILENYKQSLLTKDQIYDTFSIKLNKDNKMSDKETK